MPSPAFLAVALVALLPAPAAPAPDEQSAPIRFRHQELPFTVDNAESARRYAPETMAGGVALFDYDNDGDLDVYCANGADLRTLVKTGPGFWNRLFANDGNGNFTDVTDKAGLRGSGYDTGLAVGDYDNDGDADLFIGSVHRYTLYRNNGDGTFTDTTEDAGLDKANDPDFGPLWAVHAAFLDVNNDGLLDLFVVNYLGWSPDKEPECKYEGALEYCHPRLYPETPNSLFLNNGGGRFRDVSAEYGLRDFPGKGMGAAVADYDRDGLLDIFVTNDKLFNFLFHNTGGKGFAEIGFEAGVALAEHGNFISGMGVDSRDLDNDGWPDIAFVALDNETFPIFRNNGKLAFEEATASSGLTVSSRTMAGYSPAIYDFDNDGWKDFFVSRGHVQSTGMRSRVVIEQHNSVFHNKGNLKFAPLTAEAGFTVTEPKRHRGSAQGDLNGDGRLDIVVVALRKPAEIWFNESPGDRHWLLLELEGTKSNRDGIGAAIKLSTAAGDQYNHASFAVGYASSSAGPVHFGLGRENAARLVEIRWPSGVVQKLENVKANQVLTVKEPASPGGE